LNLILNGLPEGESREAVRYLFRPLDVFNYTEMKLFVRGDKMTASVLFHTDQNTGEYSAEVFFRFGGDTNHYYEYRQPVRYNYDLVVMVGTR
jgi:hypothetical protein